jgi:hypothetical protein
MRRPKNQITGEEDLFVGIDLHKNRWHVTIRTDVKFFCPAVRGPGKHCAAFWPDMLAIIWWRPMKPESNLSGFIGPLVNLGVPCLVTPPSLVPPGIGRVRPASGG